MLVTPSVLIDALVPSCPYNVICRLTLPYPVYLCAWIGYMYLSVLYVVIVH